MSMNIKFPPLLVTWLSVLVIVISKSVVVGDELAVASRSMILPPSDEAVQVKVSIVVLDIEAIDDATQSFTADFVIDYSWNDERLGEKAKAAGGLCRFGLDEIWNPEVQIVNQRRVFTRLPKSVEVDAEGNVYHTQRYYGSFASPLDLRMFPYDEQKIPISITSLYDASKVQIEMGEGAIETSNNLAIPGWIKQKSWSETGEYSVRFRGKETALSRGDGYVSFVRDVRFYHWKVALPIVLIVMMSWSVFWIDPKQIGPQLGAGTTAVLTIIAFLLSLRGVLPPISYLTKIDYFVYISLALVFFAYLEALVTCWLASHGRGTLAQRIDNICRVLVPLTFIVIAISFSF